jgi:hypothetical protein
MSGKFKVGMKAFGLALALAVAPGVAFSQNVDDARAFVSRLYHNYEHGDPSYLDDAEHVYTPQLLALMAKEEKTIAPGDMGVIESDPFCDCQDPTGLKDITVVVNATGTGQARADVRFMIFSQAMATTLDLAVVEGEWRVADIHSEGLKSLAGAYQRAIADATH